MPVAEFPGHHGWGYDGIYISAAQSAYGGPHALTRLVAAAHEAGLAVILDVVYNHVGASGQQALEAFGPYFTGKYSTPWGKAINYDDADCDPVREFGAPERHRLDPRLRHRRPATRRDPRDLRSERRAHRGRGGAARPRTREDALVIAESGLNDPAGDAGPRRRRLGLRRGVGRRLPPLAADARHRRPRRVLRGLRLGRRSRQRPGTARSSTTARTRRSAAGGSARRPTTCRRTGSWSSTRTTTRSGIAPSAIGCPPEARPLAAFCTLLSPYVPMLFMGEEYGEEAPFQFFSDHIDEDIAQATREGRRAEFASFAAFSGEEIPDPQDRATFERSKLTRRRDPALSNLYAELLKTRRRLPPGRCRRDRVRRGRAVAASPPRKLRARDELRAPSRAACRARADSVVLATTNRSGNPRSSTATCNSSRCPER